MQKGYIITKTRQGMDMAKLSKTVDQLSARLEDLSRYHPDVGLIDISLEVYGFCEETTETLHAVAATFQLLPGNVHAGIYREVIQDAKYGKRRRLRMKTYCGERLFRTTVSIDRMCSVVGMLARKQLVSREQAREFFKRMDGIISSLTRVRNDLGRILRNAESAVLFIS